MSLTATDILYQSLEQLRKNFYSMGSFADSNAKLEEVAKVLFCYVWSPAAGEAKDLFDEILDPNAPNNDKELIRRLNLLLQSANSSYTSYRGKNLFGESPRFEINESDRPFLVEIVRLIRDVTVVGAAENHRSHRFDLLNELFGYFIRDTFRSHIEDAQYLTPPEVVDFVSELASDELDSRTELSTESFTIMDPACGVGSFLVAAGSVIRRRYPNLSPQTLLIGQDKVDRMVRLATINALLFDTEESMVTTGNSIVGDTTIDHFQGKVDVVLTNPPFNAKFSAASFDWKTRTKYPLLGDYLPRLGSNIDSELLFIDRSLGLLKEGGILIIIVPDSVISASGQCEALRSELSRKYAVEFVIDLPAETFAQAGTRAKTSILGIRKGVSKRSDAFMAVVNNLGFDVSSRKGVKIKRYEGRNELPKVLTAYRSHTDPNNHVETLGIETVPYTWIRRQELQSAGWQPSIHITQNQRAGSETISAVQDEWTSLDRIADFVTAERKRELIPEGVRCISVLHVFSSGIVDYGALLDYRPKYQGVRCFPGDVLVSRINPHIPRITVVPDYGFSLSCSSEFEILRPKIGIDAYELVALLRLDSVIQQFAYSTSGTSSSHRRVKPSVLRGVRIPWTMMNSRDIGGTPKQMETFVESLKSLNENVQVLEESRRSMNAEMSGEAIAG